MSQRAYPGLALFVLAVLGGSGCGPSGPVDNLAAVAWKDHVRSCARSEGGSGLGTVISAVVKGDANGDGRMDTLVVDECESSTSSWPQVVEVFDGTSEVKRPTRLGTLLDGDRDYMRDVTVSVEPGGRVIVDGTGLSSNAPTCCPDLRLRKIFAWSDGRFTLVDRQVQPLPSPS